MAKPRILVLSQTNIARDARVLRQVRLLREDYDVWTCGYGPPVDGVPHIRIPDSESKTYMDGRLITLKMYRAVYWRTPSVKWILENVPDQEFDVIFANDYESVPAALKLKPKLGVHADLHEYSPLQMEDNPGWMRRIRPYREWVIRKYVPKADGWSTVCDALSDRYEEEFGFRSRVVRNTTPYWDLDPTPVSRPLRLVHHGGANAARGIDWIIESVKRVSEDVTLDLYLVDVTGRDVPRLRQVADGDPRIAIHPPAPYSKLVPTLNQYDVGLSTILPNTFNLKFALPNKLFDYIQARLAIVTGPSPEMARIVEDHRLGVVLPDFSSAALTSTLDALTVSEVQAWKNEAQLVAGDLNAENEEELWLEAIEALGEKPI